MGFHDDAHGRHALARELGVWGGGEVQDGS